VRAALGFRPHTGWATAVALGGDLRSPEVLDRRRLDLSDPVLPRQAFHTASELSPEGARELVGQAEQAAGETAVLAVSGLLDELRARGHDIVAAGVPAESARIPTELERILASHAYLHAAEGRLFRQVLADAAGRCGLLVSRVPVRELTVDAEETLGLSHEALLAALADLGRPLGPPWRQDEKDATLAAWLALATTG
jgi:hypothetical protein